MGLKIACSDPRLPKILSENADFILLIKAQIIRKRINLHKSFFMKYVRTNVVNSMEL